MFLKIFVFLLNLMFESCTILCLKAVQSTGLILFIAELARANVSQKNEKKKSVTLCSVIKLGSRGVHRDTVVSVEVNISL